jgi:hypothetical protein
MNLTIKFKNVIPSWSPLKPFIKNIISKTDSFNHKINGTAKFNSETLIAIYESLNPDTENYFTNASHMSLKNVS